MFFRKQVLLSALSATMLLSTGSFAQETNIEATLQDGPTFGHLVRPSTANVSYRYYYDQQYEGSNLVSQPSLHQVRTNIGFRLLDTIDSTLILAVNKQSGQQQLTQRHPRAWNEVNVWQGELVKLNGYAYVFFPFAGKSTQADLGLNPSVTYPINTAAGTVTLFAEVRGDAKFHSRNQDVIFDSPADAVRSGLGLVGEEGEENRLPGGQSDPSYQVDTEAFVRFTPAAAKALTVNVGLQHDRRYTPKYTYSEEDLSSRDLSYRTDAVTVNRLKVDYDLTQAVRLTNDFYYQTAGFFEGRVDGANFYGSRLMNLTYVTYKFF